MNTLEISVVVATRNRASSLARLLNGLTQQVGAPPFEVIVSDNGSRDHTARVVREAPQCLTRQYVYVDRPGKSRALNAAIRLARGELVVFTDDDVLPQPDWLAHMHAASMEFTDCNIFGGRIDVNLVSVPTWVRRSFNLMALLTSAHNLGDSNQRYGYGEYPFGPNMAIRKHLLSGMAAPYPEHMGPGTAMPTGDESGFLIQFSPPGFTDRLFMPAARVEHEVEAENVAFKTALSRCFLAGRAIGSLGLPPVARHAPEALSTPVVALERLRACSSPQELACITVRFFGYINGRYRTNSVRKTGPSPTR